ncbi:hypothetical protein A5747_13605 [Mycobacterium sp. IS-836]|nr:hypothetical protein A5747_13605 [Mycobacterium sp. IS-836]
MEVTFVGQTSHPTCKPTEVFTLTQQWCDAAQRDDVTEANRLQAEIDKHDRPAKLGPSALWYAKQGWPVFPLAPVGYTDPRRPDFLGDGKKPYPHTRGFKDATLDPDQVRRWWTDMPDSNIGLATGVMFDVIDIDGPTGVASLAQLGPDALPDVHGKVDTPRGTHYYVSPTGDGNRAGVKPGIDYRGAGGYVCAPPSAIGDRRYSWLIQPSPEIRKSA